MIVTVDTNVIFSALYSKRGASHQIMNLILEGKIKMAISPQVYFEYYEVLTRKENLEKLNLSIEDVENILDLIALLAQKNSIYFLLRPNLIDEKDNMVYECAFASNSEYLITSNIKHFKNPELKGFGFKIITPGDFYKLWESKNE
ncbi:MAG: putative toxin-antitoxin system toxin component, PIN family [Candidatus Aminicenantes bacterium]|nr:putative toxin-antitoxin system toxin component, PIN family [Candidatus Aminicenantes bacterium]NIM84736.1 putative toxin-antitoxin system toxin component, PIN family [Candidatus Aminicenantes bacterium]NIN23291.1 putative toxin-antitoxin system toxin component, PIN family [Candidatus Aminicenantes bacterium]NIN46995.1 putative toxin-antitoxin system toxin component, PIN family [Candidatus Aminicenantes bacterium]NIN89917.1 putative toxin-antitoxin system toxin component, PIN family [Candida